MNDGTPTDPFVLLSLVNTKLRNGKKALRDLCEEINLNPDALASRMMEIGYRFDAEQNRFVLK